MHEKWAIFIIFLILKLKLKIPSFGIISGIGFARAKIKLFLFISFIHSGFRAFAADTPINMSAPIKNKYEKINFFKKYYNICLLEIVL